MQKAFLNVSFYKNWGAKVMYFPDIENLSFNSTKLYIFVIKLITKELFRKGKIMETLKIELKNKKQSSMIKELLKELQIKFEPVLVESEERKAEDLYGKEFVNMIKEGRKEYLNGECKEIKVEDLWK